MSALTLFLGNKNYSSWSFRPWLALQHVGVPFEEVVIPLDQPDTAARIRAVSPSGRLPALQHGELVLWDSLAIIEYLAETFPKAQLWPQGAEARAVARAVSAEMHSGFGALREGFTMNFRRRVSPPRTPSPAAAADIQRVLALWEECRRRYGQGGPFLFGAFSGADCMYGPVVSRFLTYGVRLEGAARAYAEAMQALPAWRAWAAAAQAEPWSIAKYEQ